MPFRIKCPTGHSLVVPDSLAGKTVRCPRCQQTVIIPALDKPTVEREIAAPPVIQPIAPPVAPSTTQPVESPLISKAVIEAPPKPAAKPIPPPVVQPPVQPIEPVQAVEPLPIAKQISRIEPPAPPVVPLPSPALPPPPVIVPEDLLPAVATHDVSAPPSAAVETSIVLPPLLAITPPALPEPSLAPIVSALAEPEIATVQPAPAEPVPNDLPPSVPPPLTHHASQLLGVYHLAIAVAGMAIFSMIPGLWDVWEYWQNPDEMFIARWALVVLTIGLVQLAYAAFLWHLADWTSVWVVTMVALATAALYAMMLGITLVAGIESQLVDSLQLNDRLIHNKAELWCLCMISLATILAFFSGRMASRWQRSEAMLRAAGL